MTSDWVAKYTHTTTLQSKSSAYNYVILVHVDVGLVHTPVNL